MTLYCNLEEVPTCGRVRPEQIVETRIRLRLISLCGVAALEMVGHVICNGRQRHEPSIFETQAWSVMETHDIEQSTWATCCEP